MMEDKEKMPDVEIKTRSKFLVWLENYWYHYKWHTIIAGVAIIILVVCMWQVTTTEKHDIIMVYAGPNCLSTAEIRELEDAIGGILPSDKDGNGDKDAAFNMYQIYSAEQIEEKNAETDDTGRHMTVDTVRNTNQFSSYNQYMMTGSSSVCFLDPWLYEQALGNREGSYIRPLSEVFSEGEMPTLSNDGYGVRLGDTQLYKDFAVVRRLSPDTIVCLRSSHILGESSNDKHYQYETDVFRAILTYGSASSAQ